MSQRGCAASEGDCQLEVNKCQQPAAQVPASKRPRRCAAAQQQLTGSRFALRVSALSCLPGPWSQDASRPGASRDLYQTHVPAACGQTGGGPRRSTGAHALGFSWQHHILYRHVAACNSAASCQSMSTGCPQPPLIECTRQLSAGRQLQCHNRSTGCTLSDAGSCLHLRACCLKPREGTARQSSDGLRTTLSSCIDAVSGHKLV